MDRMSGLGPGGQEQRSTSERSSEPDGGVEPRPAPPPPPGRRAEPPQGSKSLDEPSTSAEEPAEHVLRPVPPWRHRFGLPNEAGRRPDPPGQPGAESSPSRGRCRLLLLGVGVFVVALGALGVVVAVGDGSDDGEVADDAASSDDGPAAGQEQDDDRDPPEEKDETGGEIDVGGSEVSETIDPRDLPPPEIPRAADPPAVSGDVGDLAFPVGPLDEEDVWPAVGALMVETGSGEYADTAVHLEAGELVVTLDDAMDATVELYGPDGEMAALTQVSGEPGPEDVMQFTEGSSLGRLEDTGTYVFRVVRHGGPDDDLTIAFFRPDSTT